MRFSCISDFGLNLLMGGAFNRFLLVFRVLVFIGCTEMFFNGCRTIPTGTVCRREAVVKQDQDAQLDAHSDAQIDAYLDAYSNGDYALARRIASQLALRKSDVQLQSIGLHGKVCLDMLLAENSSAFRSAVEQLLLLPSQSPCQMQTGGCQDPSGRDPRHNTWLGMSSGMLEKALAHGMSLLEAERSGILENLNALHTREEVYKKERVSMQKKIGSLGRKITALEKQNMNQKARIINLLHQISVLEKIDKERQEQRENQ